MRCLFGHAEPTLFITDTGRPLPTLTMECPRCARVLRSWDAIPTDPADPARI